MRKLLKAAQEEVHKREVLQLLSAPQKSEEEDKDKRDKENCDNKEDKSTDNKEKEVKEITKTVCGQPTVKEAKEIIASNANRLKSFNKGEDKSIQSADRKYVCHLCHLND